MNEPAHLPDKQSLREHYRARRHEMDPARKKQLDAAIFERVRALPEYGSSQLLLCYISMAREIDTYALMRDAWQAGKRVAVPRMLEDGTIAFHQIENHRALVTHSFGVLEPDPHRSVRLTDYADSVCIVPGLSFDARGYRLGYGGGYYDRFLGGPFRGGTSIGLCYAECFVPALPRGEHDVPCGIVVHEQDVHRV